MKLIHIRKTGKNKYEIELENKKIKTYDTIMLKYQLLLKKDINEELLETIEKETRNAEKYEKVVALINRKLRSEKEITSFLKKQGISSEEQKEMIEKLKAIGLLNEQTYIEAYIHHRMNLSNDGPNKIKEDLLKENFDESLITTYLEKIEASEIYEKMRKLIEKKIKMNHKHSTEYLKQKITEEMIYLGYDKDLIEEILNHKEIDHTQILKQEIKKLYQKYQKKENCIFLIRQKLYQKQYSIEEINQALEELDNC